LDGLRDEAQLAALEQQGMIFDLFESGGHALLSLFEKEPVFPEDSTEEEKAKGKELVAELRQTIKRDIKKLTTPTNI